MLMKPKVSIIVPVYKVEQYLDQCLQSLINQTLQEIEIIIINDASPDRSNQVIEKYLNNSKIKLIHHEVNKGLSATRNSGIEVAQGEYIGFVDSDDYISPDMFRTMYLAGVKNQSDLVSIGYQRCSNDGKILSKHSFPLKGNNTYNHDQLIDSITSAHRNQFIWFVPRNLYKREMIKNNKLLFNEEIKFGEDSIFNLYAFYYANKVVTIEDYFYFYRENPESLTLKKGKHYLEENLIRQFKEKKEFYSRFGFDDDALIDLYYYVSIHQLPMLLSNSVLICEEKKTSAKIREVLNLELIKESLPYVPLLKEYR